MIVDLRSDVLTKPTPEMKEAMFSAEIGDDVFGEDPGTNKLQEKVAKFLGKEAALFVTSGTMANQLAIASQTEPHDEVILDIKSHIFQFEQGAPAIISGVQLRPIDFKDLIPEENVLEEAMRFGDLHQPRSRLLCLEITHNYRNGGIPDLVALKGIVAKARDVGLKIHIDGARVWNAVVATDGSITDYSSLCDTIMFCFSKGLGAPIGSILAGPKDVIERARYIRKGLGGGWRKPGMLAAAANYALDNHIKRLADDHLRAKAVAEAIAEMPALELVGNVETNILYFRPKNGETAKFSDKLKERGVLQGWRHFNAIRLVTYLNINDEMIEYTIDQIKKISCDL